MNLYERIHDRAPRVSSCSNKLVICEPLSVKRARYLPNNQVMCESKLYAWQMEKGYVCPLDDPETVLLHEQVHLLEAQIVELSEIVLDHTVAS
jgi:hypothetical protein